MREREIANDIVKKHIDKINVLSADIANDIADMSKNQRSAHIIQTMIMQNIKNIIGLDSAALIWNKYTNNNTSGYVADN